MATTKAPVSGNKASSGNVPGMPNKGATGAGKGNAGPTRGMPVTSKTTKPPTRK